MRKIVYGWVSLLAILTFVACGSDSYRDDYELDRDLGKNNTFTYDDDDFSLRLVKIRNKVISLIHDYCINKILLEDIQLQG